MEDPNQIEVPPSFTALFTTPSGHRLTQPMAHVRERYELCEDLAQMLVERAGAEQFRSGAPEHAVLARMRQAFEGEGSPLGPDEAGWVIRRLAELLGWEPLPPDGPAA